jgi:hypothetical protein
LPPATRPAVRVAEFLDGLSEKAGDPSSGSLRSVLHDSSIDLKSAFGQMNASYQEKVQARLGKRGLEELFSLSREKHWGFFLEGWVGYSRRLRDQDKLAEAELALGQVEKWAGALGNEEQAVLAEAKRELAVLHGKGGFGRQAEFLAPRVLREGADPWAILGFGVGGAVFQGTRWAFFSRLSQSRKVGFWGARALAFGAGTIAETPAIVATAKLGREVSGVSQDWGVGAWKNEILSAGMTQLFFKGAGLVKRAQPAALLGGIYFAHQAEEVLGWRTPVSDSERITGSLSSFFQILIGGGLANGAFGKALSRWRREGELRASGSVGRREASGVLFSPSLGLTNTGAAHPTNGTSGTSQSLQGSGITLMSRYKGPGGGSHGKPPRLRVIQGEGLRVEFNREATLELAQANREQILSIWQGLERELRIIFGHRVLGRAKVAEVERMVDAYKASLTKAAEHLVHIWPGLGAQAETLKFLSEHDPASARGALGTYRTWLDSLLSRRDALFRELREVNAQLNSSNLRELRSKIYSLHLLNAYLGQQKPVMDTVTRMSLSDEILPHRVEGMLQGKPAGGNDPFVFGGRESETIWVAVALPIAVAKVQGKFFELMKFFEEKFFPEVDPEIRIVAELGGWWLCQALLGREDPRTWPQEFLTARKDGLAREGMQEVSTRLSQKQPLTALEAARWAKQGGALAAVKLSLYHFLRHPFDHERAIRAAMEAPAAIRSDTTAFTIALLGAFHGDGFFKTSLQTDLAPATPERITEPPAGNLLTFALRAFDPGAQQVEVLGFPAQWAEERGLNWDYSDQKFFQTSLEGLPYWFFPSWSALFSTQPLTAKALLARLNLLPEKSALLQDPELVRELSQSAREEMGENEWLARTSEVIAFYALTAPDFFPQTYQPLTRDQDSEWEENLVKLPPSILTHLANIEMSRPAYFLSLLSRLGISNLGEPAAATPPRK